MTDAPRTTPDTDFDRMEQARRAFAAGDHAGALELLPALVEAHPRSVTVRLLMARCLAAVGTAPVALAAAEAAVECDPSSWEAHVLVAQAAMAVHPETAAAAAEQALLLAPDEPLAQQVHRDATVAHQGGPDIASLLGPGPTATAVPVRPEPAVPSRPLPAFGARRKAATTAEEPPRPKLEPRLPRALQGVVPAGDGRLEGVTAPVPVPTAGPMGPTPPAGAVGPGPAAPPTAVEAALAPLRADPTAEEPTAAAAAERSTLRRAMLALGVLGWLFIGFRFGVQVLGGPVGILVFLAIAGAVGTYVFTQVRDTPQSTPDRET